MDKAALAAQLVAHVREAVAVAEREMNVAAEAARHGADAKTKREDNRMAIEYSRMANSQRERAKKSRLMLSMLESFHPRPLRRGEPIRVGALVEVEDDDSGEGRTFFLAPAGAGIELTGPGGDGFFTVVTPTSPMGKATLGQEVGDCFDIEVDGQSRSWEISWVG